MALLRHDALYGIILRGEAFRGTDTATKVAQITADKAAARASSSEGPPADSLRGCSASDDALRMQLCSTNALIDKVIRPLVRELSATVHVALTECSRSEGCPLVSSTLQPMLERERGVHIIGRTLQCRSRSQSDGLRRAVVTFIEGAEARGLALDRYAFVLLARHDFERRTLPVTQWRGDFGMFNFVASTRVACGTMAPLASVGTRPRARDDFVQDRLHLMPGRMLAAWAARVPGAAPRCFSVSAAWDRTDTAPSGHGCLNATRAALGAEHVATDLEIFPCSAPAPQGPATPDRRGGALLGDEWRFAPVCSPMLRPEWSLPRALRLLRGAGSGHDETRRAA